MEFREVVGQSRVWSMSLLVVPSPVAVHLTLGRGMLDGPEEALGVPWKRQI